MLVDSQEVAIDVETVIAVLRDRLGALEWENVLLQARLRRAESQLAEVIGSRSESASN